MDGFRVTKRSSIAPTKTGRSIRSQTIEAVQRVRGSFAQDKDQRFRYQGYHGHGGQGMVLKVVFKEPGAATSQQRMLMMKYGKDTKRFESERKALKDFIGCRHLGQIFIPQNDPMVASKRTDSYSHIFLEAIENGTLLAFTERYRRRNPGTTFPNRLLWSIFLCMIRACISLAYPLNDPESNETMGRLQLPQPTGYAHNDIHSANFVFGELLPDAPEHTVIPILKLIDFGDLKR
ncbi:hypothetical protein F4859DRAFT_522468 [Xylaria cf. heliscus]|nr:hypothetical protein F4859DRAFT_522468 [Xylaria cf. heliscus]